MIGHHSLISLRRGYHENIEDDNQVVEKCECELLPPASSVQSPQLLWLFPSLQV